MIKLGLRLKFIAYHHHITYVFYKSCVAKIKRLEKVSIDALNMLLKFFRVFVDGRHYGKDKNLLFPLPEAKGIPREEEDL